MAEFSYEKLPMSFLWQGSFSDEALSSPVHLKIDAKRYGNDINNYGFDIKGEVNFSLFPFERGKIFSIIFLENHYYLDETAWKRNINA